MISSPPIAQLRVYEPLDALVGAERVQADTAIERDRALGRQEVLALEQRVAEQQLLHGPMPPALERAVGAVEVRRLGQRIHVCPLLLERRVAQSLVTSIRTMPDDISAEMFGKGAPRAAERILQHVDRRLFVREQPWFVPLHWFLAVVPSERHSGEHAEGSGRRVRYLTQVGPARDRVRRAHDLVEGVAIGGVAEFLDNLARLVIWLRGFDETALLELDYGRVPDLLGDGWDDERTCDELHQAVESLAEDNLPGAVQAYLQARSRWEPMWTLVHGN